MYKKCQSSESGNKNKPVYSPDGRALFKIFFGRRTLFAFKTQKGLRLGENFKKRVRTAGLRVIEFLNVLLLKIYKIIVVILLHQN
jgi:hypothetical protein